MGDFTDLCVCGNMKLKTSKKCINCIKNKSKPENLSGESSTGPIDLCACGKRKLKISSKCLDCIKGSRQNNPRKCTNCKNHAKKDSDLCGPCEKSSRGICRKKDCNNRVSFSKGHRYCGLHQPTQNSKGTNPNRSKANEVPKGKFVCDVCGKQHIGGNIAKGAQQVVGGSIMGIFGTLTMLTGGLTAPLMLGAATAGAALFGAAENYSTCSECRNK